MDTEPLDEDLWRLGTMSAQWCNQDQILKTKTKIGRRPPEVIKDTSWIWLLSKWTPLLISTVVMFQAQNRATINTVVLEKTRCPSRSLWRRAWQYRVSQHSTRPARPRPIFLVSNRSCPKTDGPRPHHWMSASYNQLSGSVVIGGPHNVPLLPSPRVN